MFDVGDGLVMQGRHNLRQLIAHMGCAFKCFFFGQIEHTLAEPFGELGAATR